MAGIEKFRAETAEECEKVEVGDRVRSYDFEFRDDCYIEGEVKHIGLMIEGCERYTIYADIHCSAGVRSPIGHNVYPPVNGTRNWLGGFTNGVRKVEA